MAKTLVYEGCPACSTEGYGQLAIAPTRETVTSMIQGGAIGAGAATALDFLIPRIPFVSRLPLAIRPVLNGGISVLVASILYSRNPSLAVGIGIGGVAVSAYKLLATLVGKVAAIPTAGYGQGEVEEESPVEVETTEGTGVIVPTEEEYAYSYGQEEVLID